MNTHIVSLHYHKYCAIITIDVCYIIMSRMALQLLEEWLCCMQHDSSGISVVASSSFQMPNYYAGNCFIVNKEWRSVANSWHMLSDTHSCPWKTRPLLWTDGKQSLRTIGVTRISDVQLFSIPKTF